MPRKTYVPIGEASRIAGVSVDTLRRRDDAGVYRETSRTEGGQRRFCVEELESVRDSGGVPEPSGIRRPQPDRGRKLAVPLDTDEEPRDMSVPTWEARMAEAHADVEVTRARIEQREEIRRYREAEEARENARRADAVARAAESRRLEEQAKRRAEAQQSIDACVRRIRVFLPLQPAETRVEVERFLAEHAAIGSSPLWIESEVAAIQDRHRRARDEAAQRANEEAARRQNELVAKARQEADRSRLLDHAVQHARSVTSDREEWDAEDAEGFVDAVRDELPSLVQPNWTTRQVERAVKEMLSEWD